MLKNVIMTVAAAAAITAGASAVHTPTADAGWYNKYTRYAPVRTYKTGYALKRTYKYGYARKHSYGYKPSYKYGYALKHSYGYKPTYKYGYALKHSYGYKPTYKYGYALKHTYGYGHTGYVAPVCIVKHKKLRIKAVTHHGLRWKTIYRPFRICN